MTKKKAERVIDTLTGPWEKKVLRRLALALPERIVPDHLTVLALIGTLISGIAYILAWRSHWWLFVASLGFVINWYGDSLDGTLARVRHIERERYGYFVDHIADAFTTVFICITLGISPYMQIEIAMTLAIGYLLLNVYTHISAYTQGEFRISYLKFGPTEIRIMIILFNTMLFFWNGRIIKMGEEYLTFMDLGGVTVCVLFIALFTCISFKTAFYLDKQDRANKQK